MREKLLFLMKSEGLTPSRLAELLGIQPSGISHILAGRNKPSFDLVQKILRRFPSVDPDWLILDKESMTRTTPVKAENNISTNIGSSETTTDSQKISAPQSAATLFAADESSMSGSRKEDDGQQMKLGSADMSPFVRGASKKVRRVIVLFEDHTFESYE